MRNLALEEAGDIRFLVGGSWTLQIGFSGLNPSGDKTRITVV